MTTQSTTVPDWKVLSPEGPLLRPAEAAQFLSISVSSYYALAKSGTVPSPVKITPNGRASGVPKNVLEAFVRSRMLDMPEVE